jgi:hypothetical protein
VRHLRRPAVFVPLLGALASLAAAHCGDDSTGRSRITVDAVVRGTDPGFTTSTGWRVTVAEARVVLGPLRWYEGAPLFSRTRLERLLGVSVAYAHPGHYVAGEALADITARRVVDLLPPGGTALPQGNGVTGIAQSAAIELRPAEATVADAATLHGGTLYVRGDATKDGRTVRFDCAPALTQTVQGIPARGDMATSGRWEITIDLRTWIDRADFATVAEPATPGGVVTLTEGQPFNAITRTAPAASGFAFRWVPAGAGAGAP